MKGPENEMLLLDINNPIEITSYEKALYRSFSSSLTNTSDLIFDINHKEKTLRTKIPYNSQEIYTYKWSDAIVAGMAINFNMQKNLQLELLNFNVVLRENACEALIIFSVLDFFKSMSVLKLLAECFIKRIEEKNISTVYATSSEKRSISYKQLGFRVIDRYMFEGQGKCLLQLDR